jgi:hypothetical protein
MHGQRIAGEQGLVSAAISLPKCSTPPVDDDRPSPPRSVHRRRARRASCPQSLRRYFDATLRGNVVGHEREAEAIALAEHRTRMPSTPHTT